MTDLYDEMPEPVPMPVPSFEPDPAAEMILEPGDYEIALDLLDLPPDTPAVAVLLDDHEPDAPPTPDLDDESEIAVTRLPADDVAAMAEWTVTDPGAKQIVLTPHGSFSIACDYPEPVHRPEQEAT